MSQRLLTIVTPCLNSAATLPETLRSVRDQHLGDEVEHVIVDGGSTDGTLELLRSTAGIRWISEPDRGLSDAVNKGVAMATGTYVGWLNADDYYLPGALRHVRAAIEDGGDPVWITGPCVIVDAEGREIRRAVTAYRRFFLRHHSFRSLLAQNHIASPATFVRRDTLLDLGGFDERFRYSMDYDMWLKLARRAAPAVIDEPLSAFRMAGESLSMTGFEEQFAEHARNARENGAGHPFAVALNAAVSRLIVLAYRAMRARRS